MSKVIAKETRYFYMLDDFQKDVAKKAHIDREDVIGDISNSTMAITNASAEAMETIFLAVVTNKLVDMERLIGAVSDILWEVARTAELAGVQLSDVAGFAVDKHDDQPNRRVM